MPYYYKREITDLNNTGQQVFRYEIRSEGNVSLEMLAKKVRSRYRTLGEGEIVGIASTLIDAIKESLASGHTVSINELGTFSLGIGLRNEKSMVVAANENEDASEPNARSIGVKTVHFRAAKQLVNEIDKSCQLYREPGGTAHIHRTSLTREQRIQTAIDYINDHGFMRLSDYATLVGVSRAVASRDLSNFVHDSEVPITTDGVRSHKVYIMES